MNKLIALSVAVAAASAMAMAQTPVDSLKDAYSRIQVLEQTVQQQNANISKLTSDVNEVLKQNLALKQNLHLTPTKAKSNACGVEYRVIEVTGDKNSQDVHVIMSASLIGEGNAQIMYRGPEIIDELGNGYNGRFMSQMKIEGISDDLRGHIIDFHHQTPYTIDLTINKYNPSSQYIKYISLEMFDSSSKNKENVVFENLLIKWVTEE